jgi:TspO/MBR family protein
MVGKLCSRQNPGLQNFTISVIFIRKREFDNVNRRNQTENYLFSIFYANRRDRSDFGAMDTIPSGTDKFRAVLVLAATIGMIAFNWLAATGRISGVTPELISARHATPLTPAPYVFTIWSLICVGMIAFSILQVMPTHMVRFRSIRSLYIFSAALNCAWLYFWLADQMAICLVILVALFAVLLMINVNLRTTESPAEYWLVKGPFGLYFGWISVALFLNLAIVLSQYGIAESMMNVTAIVSILIAAGFGILARASLANYFYSLAVAWGLTAIAVKQSGHTAVVATCAAGVIACLITALSFVVNLPSSTTRSEPPA